MDRAHVPVLYILAQDDEYDNSSDLSEMVITVQMMEIEKARVEFFIMSSNQALPTTRHVNSHDEPMSVISSPVHMYEVRSTVDVQIHWAVRARSMYSVYLDTAWDSRLTPILPSG